MFGKIENIIQKIDLENLELCLLGDLNCNLLADKPDENVSELTNIIDIYGLSQIIEEPTRTTQNSQTLLDLFITNFDDKITESGVLHLGISDHSLIYVVRKATYKNSGASQIISKRNFKFFKNSDFVMGLNKINWHKTYQFSDPNEAWAFWKEKFMIVINDHAPIHQKRVGKRKSPWINNDLLRKIRKRD